MDFNQLIDDITPEIYQNLKRAVEIGKWPDGRVLTGEQRALSMQAVIAFEARHMDESERTGFIDRGSKAQGEVCDDDTLQRADAEQVVKWRQ
jgi:uncharacterized protein